MKYDKQLNTRIPLATLKKLKALSKKKKLTFSQTVRLVLETGIEKRQARSFFL